MIDKKQIFQIVYAIALIGAIVTCFGFLSAILELLLTNGVYVRGLGTITNEIFFVPLAYYLVSLLFGVLAVIVSLNSLRGSSNGKRKTGNAVLVIAIVVLLGLASTMQFFFWLPMVGDYRALYPLEYSLIGSFRASAMSMVAYFVILIGCNRIRKKYNKQIEKQEADQADSETESV